MNTNLRRTSSKLAINSTINIVPYVDVMLVLIVILLASVSSILPSLINLPNVGQKSAKVQKPIMIVIYKDGKTSFNKNEKQDLPDIISQIKSKYKLDQPIVIAGDKDAKYDYIISSMSILKQAGFTRVGLLVKHK